MPRMPGVPWHPASLTKLMTAYVAFAAIKDGRVSLDTQVKVRQHAWNQAPAKSGLEVGDVGHAARTRSTSCW